MKKKQGIVLILIVITILSFIMPCNTYATTPDEIIGIGKSWLEVGKDHTNGTMDPRTLMGAINQILNILFPIAVVITIIIGAIIGIQIMMSPIDGKADAKKSLIPFAISCAVIYGSIGIWKIAVTIIGLLE